MATERLYFRVPGSMRSEIESLIAARSGSVSGLVRVLLAKFADAHEAGMGGGGKAPTPAELGFDVGPRRAVVARVDTVLWGRVEAIVKPVGGSVRSVARDELCRWVRARRRESVDAPVSVLDAQLLVA